MKTALFALTLLSTLGISVQTFAAAVPAEEAYHCIPSSPQTAHEIDSVDVRKDAKTQLITTEVNIKTGVATIGYTAEVKYIENPKFAFPEWDGAGVNFITEKKARDFKAADFVGNISGQTPDFNFSANLSCKKLGLKATTIARK